MLTDEQIDSADMQSLSWMAPRGKDSVREFARAIESAATAPLLAEIERLKAQADQLVLERLSISEAKTIVSQHVEGEMTGDDWTIINAVQSAIAAKNGAKLK